MFLRAVPFAVLPLVMPLPATADLAGRWVSVGPNLFADVEEHLEVLDIAPDGAVTVEVWRMPPLLDVTCVDPVHPDPERADCTNPVNIARGRVAADPDGRFSILSDAALAAPFDDPREVENWQESSALSPLGWEFALDGDRLAVTRVIDRGGMGFRLTRLYHRDGPEFDTQLFGFLTFVHRQPLSATVCGLDVILADPGLRAEFTAHLATTVPVIHEMQREARGRAAAGDPLTEEDTDAASVIFVRQVRGDPASAPEGFDAEGWAALVDTMRWAAFGDFGPLFPAAEPVWDAMRDCDEVLHAPVLPLAAELPELPPPDVAALISSGLLPEPVGDDEGLAGIWMHAFGMRNDPAAMMRPAGAAGDESLQLPDHLEVLQIARDGVISVFLYRDDPDIGAPCAADSTLPFCAYPVEVLRGQLTLDGTRLAIVEAEQVTPPWLGDRFAAAWAELQIAADDWEWRHSGNLLEISGERAGAPVTRRYLRVGPGFPAAFDEFYANLAYRLDLSMTQAGCALDAILVEPDLAPALTAHIERMLAAVRALADLYDAARASNDPAAIARYREINSMINDQVWYPDLAVVAPEEIDPDAWATYILNERWIDGDGRGKGIALFPAAVPLLPAIEACVDNRR